MKKHQETYSPKKPWVPPPGRTAKKSETAIEKTKEDSISEDIHCYNTKLKSFRPHESFNIETKRETFSSSYNIQIYSPPSTIILPEIGEGDYPFFPDITYNSMIRNSSKEIKIEEIYLAFQKIKEDSNNFHSTRDSLSSVLEVLHRPILGSVTENLTINCMITQSIRHVDEFFHLYNEFENHIASSDLISRQDIEELNRYLNKTTNCKTRLYAKLLQAYDSVTSSLKFVIEVMQEEYFSAEFENCEALKKEIEDLQNSFLDREVKIKQLEKDLQFSQDKICILEKEKEIYGKMPEPLENKFQNWNSEANFLWSELHAYKPDPKLIGENTRLLKIYGDVRKAAESEILTLKKALIIRKSSLDHFQTNAHNLQEKLDVKERELLKLAQERDDWKSKLTNMNNKLVEAENQIEHLKITNTDLQKKLDDLQETYKSTLSKMESTVNEKSNLLDVVTNEKAKLNEDFVDTEKKFLSSQNEIKLLEKKYASLEAKLEAQINCAKNVSTNSENDINLIIPLLQELKDSLTAIRENGLQPTKKPNHKEFENGKFLEENLLGLVKEIKNLIESKETHHYSMGENITNQQIASVENKFQELRDKHDREILAKEKYLAQLQEDIKSAEIKNSSLKVSSFEADFNLLNLANEDKKMITNLQSELRDKNEELARNKRQWFET